MHAHAHTEHHAYLQFLQAFCRDIDRQKCSKATVTTFSALFALTALIPMLATGAAAMTTPEASPNVWQAWATLGAVMGGILTALILTIYRAKDEEYRFLSPVLLVALNVSRALLAAPASLLALTYAFAKWPEMKVALSEHWLLMSSAGAMTAIPFFILMAVTILRLDRIKGGVAERIARAAEEKLTSVLPADTAGK